MGQFINLINCNKNYIYNGEKNDYEEHVKKRRGARIFTLINRMTFDDFLLEVFGILSSWNQWALPV